MSRTKSVPLKFPVPVLVHEEFVSGIFNFFGPMNLKTIPRFPVVPVPVPTPFDASRREALVPGVPAVRIPALFSIREILPRFLVFPDTAVFDARYGVQN